MGKNITEIPTNDNPQCQTISPGNINLNSMVLAEPESATTDNTAVESSTHTHNRDQTEHAPTTAITAVTAATQCPTTRVTCPTDTNRIKLNAPTNSTGPMIDAPHDQPMNQTPSDSQASAVLAQTHPQCSNRVIATDPHTGQPNVVPPTNTPLQTSDNLATMLHPSPTNSTQDAATSSPNSQRKRKRTH